MRSQDALTLELDRIAACLEAALAGDPAPEPGPPAHPETLEMLVDAFGLSSFERDLLLLCAGAELQTRIARLCGGGGEDPARPTFGLALAALPDPHWSALVPAAPLRRWRMVEPDPGGALTTAPLHLDERVLHHLADVPHLDVALEPLLERAAPPPVLPPSQEPAAETLATARGLVVLVGAEADTRRAVTAHAHARAGVAVHVVAAADLPAAAADRADLARRWEREAALGAGMLMIELPGGAEPAVLEYATAFADAVRTPVVLSAAESPAPGRRTAAHLDIPSPRGEEQRDLWAAALGAAAVSQNGTLDRLTGQFDLGGPAIADAAAQADGDPDTLWEVCRAQGRPRLGTLAQRIEPVAGWDDLVLPAPECDLLREITAHVRRRARVHDQWGFAGASRRGLGISALFEGPSGTGKTMVAEVLARELSLDLYRIDLSQVVSKYIGETERNLSVVFDAAESGAAILLFDEADALFGTRTEVKDSHDRYANIEVSYLLQRMETYRGLAILTTNAREAIDPAFLRRLRFVVRFPFPGEDARTEIWRRVFPARTPTDGLDPARLARLNLAGGNIRNVALSAAFLAADAGEPVRMTHVARAARGECRKIGRPLAEAEVAAWT